MLNNKIFHVNILFVYLFDVNLQLILLNQGLKMKHLLTLKRRIAAVAIVMLISNNILKADTETNLPAANSGSELSTLSNHFQPVWWGENGYGHMNINIINAKLNNEFLGVNDEIAVFNGSLCVGSVKLTTTSDNIILNIIASQDDGTGNGFTPGDTIIFKIWDNKTAKEVTAIQVKYITSLPNWLASGNLELTNRRLLKLPQKVQNNRR